MRRSIFPVIAVLCLPGVWNSAVADDAAKPPAASPTFELLDGDRVVFLGNTLIERAQKYGYWETMLTARYPDRDITFRNLGWSGDTVWAESRGIFDPPAVGYQRMIEHVGRLKPTVIFLGYGNNEAFAGKAGLPAFIKQYNKLLDDLTRVSAEGVRFVLLSPTWVKPVESVPSDHEEQNRSRVLYRDAVSEIATERSAVFYDFYSSLMYAIRINDKDEPMTDRAGQLTERGYRFFGIGLKVDLFPNRKPVILQVFNVARLKLTTEGKVRAQTALKADNIKRTESDVSMEITFKRLKVHFLRLKVAGLSAGEYAIKVDRIALTSRDSEDLRDGTPVQIFHNSENVVGPDESQYEKLRQTIIDKNRLYFYRWRPQNITYLFGFRKHEQGQNAKELAEFDKLIAAKEAEINKLKKPVPHTYEIIRVKDKPAKEQGDEQSQKQ